MLEVVLNELAPVCNAEQDFCVRFFHLASTVEEDSNEQVYNLLCIIYLPHFTKEWPGHDQM